LEGENAGGRAPRLACPSRRCARALRLSARVCRASDPVGRGRRSCRWAPSPEN